MKKILLIIFSGLLLLVVIFGRMSKNNEPKLVYDLFIPLHPRYGNALVSTRDYLFPKSNKIENIFLGNGVYKPNTILAVKIDGKLYLNVKNVKLSDSSYYIFLTHVDDSTLTINRKDETSLWFFPNNNAYLMLFDLLVNNMI